MEKLFENEYLIMLLDSEKAAIEIIWLPENQSMSLNEYIEQWVLISKYVHVLKIRHLLIDAYDFKYRIVPETYSLLSDMLVDLKPENIALIMSKDFLGRNTLTDLLKHINYNRVNIFQNKNEGSKWLESQNEVH